MFLEQMLRMLTGLLVGLWVARYLGPQNLGIFSYVLAFTALFSGLAKLGIDNILIRELVSKPHLHDLYMGTAFWLKVCGAFFSLICICLTLVFIKSDIKTDVYILIIACGLIFQSFEVVDFYYQSQVKVKFISICKLLQLLFSSALKIYLVINNADLTMFVLVSFVDQLTLAISYYWLYSRKHKSFFGCFDTKVAIQLIKEGLPWMTAGLIWGACMRVDQIIIQHQLSSASLGLYCASLRVAELTHIIPVVLCASFFPSIISAKTNSIALYNERLVMLCSLVLWLGIVLAVFVNLVSTPLIKVLYGDKFQGADLLLTLFIWSSLFVFYGTVLSYWLVAEGKQVALNKSCFVILVFNFTVTYFTAESIGLWWVATVKVISYALLYTIVLSYFLKSTFPITMFLKSLNPNHIFKYLAEGIQK